MKQCRWQKAISFKRIQGQGTITHLKVVKTVSDHYDINTY